MIKFTNTIKAEFLNLLGELKAYYIDYIFHNFNIFMLFLGLFYGMNKDMSSPDEIVFFIVGLIVWWYATISIQSVSIIVQSEARQGTLEQIFMTKTDMSVLILCRLIANYLFETLQMIFVVSLCIISFGLTSSFQWGISFINIIINILVCLIGLSGMGYFVAGLAIIYKKVDAIARATSNLILFFSGLIIPLSAIPNMFHIFAKLFPFYWSMESIKNSTYNSLSILGLGTSEFAWLFGISVFWMLVGIMSFKTSIATALKKGSISHY
ncbi:ABC-2 type transporter [Clostridium collagenovorans DSM 3089]|uniref:Transport permease protein n=1 Tax=Clostridium collagenovorans DSM 3089 TaxID=1121306 RepID=A0A1M5X5W9_9CLOT|nr:ABC transporter permease [Clostridium collagenovorans]SHH95176.1 ABC-2 type transporter [Clostridium collagenovorans DSM 3089]